MTEVNRMLFGVDNSDFSRTSLAAAGKLIANDQRLSIDIFHAAPDMSIISSKYAQRGDEDRESKDCLEKAKRELMDAGVQEERISVILEENRNDPAGTMIDLAEDESFDIIGLARFGESTIGRHVIGSVTSRVTNSSEKVPVWIVDHRVEARHVLVCLVGAPIGQRIIDHVANHFSHLQENRFTLYHVVSPFTLKADLLTKVLSEGASEQEKERLTQSVNRYLERTEETLEEGRRKLIHSGIPEKNIQIKKQAQEEGIARDILTEMERGDNGILVVGRKGSKEIQQYSLGSKAYKLLCAARPFMFCLVN